MKNMQFAKQTADIFFKILVSFIMVFVLYFISELVNNFIYNFFVFPLLSITIIFVCGVNVGRSLERISMNQNLIGTHKKNSIKTKEKESLENTEFVINDTNNISKNKKILKEFKEGDKIHIKVINYDDINDERDCE